MKQITIILMLAGLFLQATAQNKNVNGIIYDDYTNYHVDSVKITSKYQNRTAISNQKGRFSISLPRGYRDTIVFSHPDYYPFVIRIGAGVAMRPQFIRLIPLTYQLDTVLSAAYKENISVTGVVEDAIHREPITNAQIRLEDNKIIAYSKPDGKFKTVVPKSAKHLIINHPEFNTLVIPVSQVNQRTPYPEIKMDREILIEKDTIWKKWNNHIGMSINELISAGIGMRYERFVHFRHSVGLHSTYYFRGIAFPLPFTGGASNKFNGVKISPFYRFYVWRKFNAGGYAETKLTTGYFDFSSLNYKSREGSYADNIATNFWTTGIAVAWGWYIRPKKIDHLLFNLSVGFQYLPIKAPKSIKSQHNGTYYVDDIWWYVTGPGSVLEIKITIGGIF